MSGTAIIALAALILTVVVTSIPLGRYMARVYGDGPAPGDRLFGPIEKFIYRLCGVDPSREQRWTAYAYSVLAFGVVSFLALYGLQRVQGELPVNPTDVAGVAPHTAFNAAVSFMTNTNWQSYSGESTLSHLTQVTGMTVQNFVSAAAGTAVMAALIRGLARRRRDTIGNFWVDLTRSTVRILLPLSFVVALLLAGQGVIQNFDGYREATTVEGAVQLIPGGPVASQVAIKQLGTNGGGFFNANSAHPFENPTALTNLIENWAILVIPLALAITFGEMLGDRRQGWAVFAVMMIIWLAITVGTTIYQTSSNPLVSASGVTLEAGPESAGGSYEGVETRFGPAACAVWAASTTGTSNGSVNCMHDSMAPLAGGLALSHIALGEVSPGGVGVGLNGMLVFVMLAVFIAGLMVGRTPEYLGKKVQAAEMKLISLYLLAMPLVLLGFAAASVLLDDALASRANPGPHGLSEILYAYASGSNNNGSAFAGLNAATPWYDITIGLSMLVGRFFLIVPVLAIAGSMVRKERAPESPGTLPTHTPLFCGLVVGVVAVVAGLTFFPALALGPLVEQLSL
jgi:K+-transporting ATPase ATPase A chain